MSPLVLLLLPGFCLTSLLEPFNGEEAEERRVTGRGREERRGTGKEREERRVTDREAESDMNNTSYNRVTVVEQQEQKEVTEQE